MVKKLKITLKTADNYIDNEISGIYDEDREVLKYFERDKTSVVLDLKNKTLIRNNNNIYLKYIFGLEKNTSNLLKVKGLNKELEIIIKTNKFNVTNNLIEIIYEIVDSKEQFIYKIEY